MRKPPHAETLTDLLMACGLGPTEAARMSGLNRNLLTGWLHGRLIRAPQLAKVAALAAGLGVPPQRVMAAIMASRRQAQEPDKA